MCPNDFLPNQNSEMIISKAILEKRRHRRNMSAYYSFLTIVLFFCLLQISFSAVLNISKVLSYKSKIKVMQDTKAQVLKKNNQLKTEIENFSTSSSWESIARNNLKMAGENEILVIFDEKEEPTDTGNKNGKHRNNRIN